MARKYKKIGEKAPIRKTRKFSGKNYKAITARGNRIHYFTFKSQAQTQARNTRRDGYNARLVNTTWGWVVFNRKRRR